MLDNRVKVKLFCKLLPGARSAIAICTRAAAVGPGIGATPGQKTGFAFRKAPLFVPDSTGSSPEPPRSPLNYGYRQRCLPRAGWQPPPVAFPGVDRRRFWLQEAQGGLQIHLGQPCGSPGEK